MLFKGYTVNYQHRGKLTIAQKSQWRVSEWEELRLFLLAQSNEWICSKKCLWAVDEEFHVIGEGTNGNLFIAKYSPDQDNWHGFPVSPKRDGDRPPSETLKDWVNRGFVRKSVATKMAQGKF